VPNLVKLAVELDEEVEYVVKVGQDVLDDHDKVQFLFSI
jgi:hypothetical protein